MEYVECLSLSHLGSLLQKGKEGSCTFPFAQSLAQTRFFFGDYPAGWNGLCSQQHSFLYKGLFWSCYLFSMLALSWELLQVPAWFRGSSMMYSLMWPRCMIFGCCVLRKFKSKLRMRWPCSNVLRHQDYAAAIWFEIIACVRELIVSRISTTVVLFSLRWYWLPKSKAKAHTQPQTKSWPLGPIKLVLSIPKFQFSSSISNRIHPSPAMSRNLNVINGPVLYSHGKNKKSVKRPWSSRHERRNRLYYPRHLIHW